MTKGDTHVAKNKRIGKLWDWTVILVIVPMLLVAALVAGVFAVNYTRGEALDMPSTGSGGGIVFRTQDNKVVGRLLPGEGPGAFTPSDRISDNMKNAIVSAEDGSFWSNPGFDIKGIARAAIGNITGGDGQGGASTITQQLVKNSTGDDEIELNRKVREVVSSIKTTTQEDKDDILTAYLNSVFYGRNSYGIESAARAYFGVSASELTVEQAAVLAGAVQSPSILDPANNFELAKNRWDYVLDRMLANGYITQAERRSAAYPKAEGEPMKSFGMGTDYGHSMLAALRELRLRGIDRRALEEAGATIELTLDSKQQKTLADIMRADEIAHGFDTGAVAVEGSTGEVKARWSGDDGEGWDRVDNGQMLGSTMKPLALAAYLSNGGSLDDNFSSAPYDLNGTQIGNSEGMSCGTCSIREATVQSLNTSFMRMQDRLPHGAETTADMMYRLGIRSKLPDGSNPLKTEDGWTPPTNLLGSARVPLDDMAAAFATIENDGVRVKKHIVRSVQSAGGNVIYKAPTSGERVLSSSAAQGVTSAMAPIAKHSNNHVLGGGLPSAYKTGTVALGDTGQTRDAAGVGYNTSPGPNGEKLSLAVWVGNRDGSALIEPGGGAMFGAQTPSRLWSQALTAMLSEN